MSWVKTFLVALLVGVVAAGVALAMAYQTFRSIESAAIPRTVTYMVAASNALASEKAHADYVADGTDDQVEIQAAIDALDASISGTIQLSAGNFNISAPIKINKFLALVGEGHGWWSDGPNTTIRLADGSDSNMINIDAPGLGVVVLRDFLLWGNKDNQTSGNGIVIGGTNHHDGVWLTEVAVDQVKDNGIVIRNAENVWIDKSTTERNGGNGILIDASGAQKVVNTKITNSYLGDNDGRGLYASVTGDFREFVFTGNTVVINELDGIRLDGLSRGGLIASNNIRNSSGVAGYSGIRLNNSYGVSIIGNEICFPERTVTENHGIYGTNSAENVIIGNVMDRIGGRAIWLDTQRNTIIGNTIYSAGQAADNTYEVIFLDGSSYNNVIGNNIDSFVVNKHKYGIAEGDGTNHNVITGNSLNNAATANIHKNGADTIVRDNIGYVTENSGSATITAGQTSVAINHGLAATLTRVQLTPVTDTAGKRYWVSAKEATTFTITIDSAHTDDMTFDWRATVGEGN